MKLLTFIRISIWGAALVACGIAHAATGTLPPDISAALADARRAWRVGDECNEKLGKQVLGETDTKVIDELLDKRDKAFDRAKKSFEDALKLDPGNPHGQMEFGR